VAACYRCAHGSSALGGAADGRRAGSELAARRFGADLAAAAQSAQPAAYYVSIGVAWHLGAYYAIWVLSWHSSNSWKLLTMHRDLRLHRFMRGYHIHYGEHSKPVLHHHVIDVLIYHPRIFWLLLSQLPQCGGLVVDRQLLNELFGRAGTADRE
jgi:hypothetical protein